MNENSTKTTHVFINYRHGDAIFANHYIFEKLSQYLLKENIFLDVKDIDIGDNFEDRLTHSLAKTNILLVLIGEKWLSILKERSDKNEKDWVRTEIEICLDSNKCTVIPVYLDKNNFIKKEDLPDNLRSLSSLSAETLSNNNLDANLEILAKKIIDIIYKDPFDFWSDKLRNFYHSQKEFNYITIPISLSQLSIELSMKDYFITPSYINSKDLENRDQIQTNEKSISFYKIKRNKLQNFIPSDILFDRWLKHPDNIIIIGNPGVGKSTFAQWLCFKWLNDYTYPIIPIYVSLKSLNSKSENNIFLEYLSRLIGLPISIIIQHINKLPSKLYWILDGYDELSNDKKLKLFNEFESIAGYKFNYILLTRPYGLIGNNYFPSDRIYQLDGFSQGQIDQYIENYLNQVSKINNVTYKSAAIKNTIASNKVLSDYSHTPLMLAFTMYILTSDSSITFQKTANLLSSIDSQYELQSIFHDKILQREVNKATRNINNFNIKEIEKYSFELEINQKVLDVLDQYHDYRKAPANICDLGFGRMIIQDPNIVFTFNTLTFQEFFATRFLIGKITENSLLQLTKVPFFWNFTNMIIGGYGTKHSKKRSQELISLLTRFFQKTDEESAHSIYHLYSFLGECPKNIVNHFATNELNLTFYQLYKFNGSRSEKWSEILLNSFGKIYVKLDINRQDKIKELIINEFNPIPLLKTAEGNRYSLNQSIKFLIDELKLWNDNDFVKKAIDLIKKLLPKMEIDGEFDIAGYEPIETIISDILPKISNEIAKENRTKLRNIIKKLPEEFKASKKRLEINLEKRLDKNFMPKLKIVLPIEEINSLLKIKKLSKKRLNILTQLYFNAVDTIFSYAPSIGLDIPTITTFLEQCTRISIKIVDEIDDELLFEDVFQLLSESVKDMNDERIYLGVFQFAAVFNPSYTNILFSDTERLNKWYLLLISDAYKNQRKDNFNLISIAFTLNLSFQNHFINYSDKFCSLMERYILKHRNIFDSLSMAYTEVRINDKKNDNLKIIRPLEKILEYGRSEQSAEMNKLILVDFILSSKVKHLKYIRNAFLPGLLNNNFNLYHERHFSHIFSYCNKNELSIFITILKNTSIYAFESNKGYLLDIGKELIKYKSSDKIKEKQFILLLYSSLTIKLLKKTKDNKYKLNYTDFRSIFQKLIPPSEIHRSLNQDNLATYLAGNEVLAYLYLFLIDESYKIKDLASFKNDYICLYDEMSHPDRRLFIQDLCEFIYIDQKINEEYLAKLQNFLEPPFFKKIEVYIRSNYYDVNFSVEEFELTLKSI